MKTSKLTGAALDWAVAKCSFVQGTARSLITSEVKPYSTDWAAGGPIIERELIEIYPLCDVEWGARKVDSEGDLIRFYGDTPLIAAMRCYVAAKLGEVVDVPVELLSDDQAV